MLSETINQLLFSSCGREVLLSAKLHQHLDSQFRQLAFFGQHLHALRWSELFLPAPSLSEKIIVSAKKDRLDMRPNTYWIQACSVTIIANADELIDGDEAF